MAKVHWLLVVALLGGCATVDRHSFTPGEAQEAWRNPYLLNCRAGTIAVCDSSGNFIRKAYTNCRCTR